MKFAIFLISVAIIIGALIISDSIKGDEPSPQEQLEQHFDGIRDEVSDLVDELGG